MAKIGQVFLLRQDWMRNSRSSTVGIGIAVNSNEVAKTFKGVRGETEYDYETIDVFDNWQEAMVAWEKGEVGTCRGMSPFTERGNL